MQAVTITRRSKRGKIDPSFVITHPAGHARDGVACRPEATFICDALETDWLAGAGGFEPLHFRIGIRQDSQPGAAGFEPLHMEINKVIEWAVFSARGSCGSSAPGRD